MENISDNVCVTCRKQFPGSREVAEHRAQNTSCEPHLSPANSSRTNPYRGDPPGDSLPRIRQPRSPLVELLVQNIEHTTSVIKPKPTPVSNPKIAQGGEAFPIEIEGYLLNNITLPPNFFETLENEGLLRGQRSPTIIDLARTISQEQLCYKNTLSGRIAFLMLYVLDGSYYFLRCFAIGSLLLAFVYCCTGDHSPKVQYFMVGVEKRISFLKF